MITVGNEMRSFLSFRHHPYNVPVMQLMHHSAFDIFKMAFRMVADKFYKPVGAAPSLWWICNIQISCLMKKHFTNRCI